MYRHYLFKKMEEQNISLRDLSKLMRSVFRVFKRRVDELPDEVIKISTEQFGLLHAISVKEEDVIQKDMAEMMGKDKSLILRLIDSLEEKELVRRVADLKDRRKNYLMVTKVGQRTLELYMKVLNELVVEVQQGSSQEEIENFNIIVDRLTINVDKL